MSDYYTCTQCGKKYEKKGFSKFASGATMGISNLGKHFCSSGCRKAYERDNEKKRFKIYFF